MAAVTLGRPEQTGSEALASPHSGGRPRLRIGLVADSRFQPRWLVQAFARVASSSCTEVAVIVDLGADAPAEPWLWKAYCRLDHRVFGRGEDLLELLDLAESVPHGRTLKLMQGQAREPLQALDLDVLFSLGNVPAGSLDCAARYGVWRYGFGPGGNLSAAAAGLCESDAASLTASGLLAKLPGDRCERLLCQAWSRNLPLSLARTRRGLLPKTSQFAMRALKNLHASGPGWIAACDRVTAGGAAAVALPPAGDCLRHVSRLAPYIARRSLQSLLYVDQWFLAFRFGGEERWDGDLRNFRLIMPPRDRFWADPFPIERGGRHFVFFEELVFAKGKAHIAVLEVDRAGRWSRPRAVLERDYHLSYPFLVEHAGELYMIPETGHNRTVEVYRCVAFPDQWRLEKVLLKDLCTADATFHQAHGKWWMFVGIYAEGSEFAEGAEELHVFHCDELLGQWKPHAANPVKSDVRSGRPAGRLYQRNGALYRPAQIGVPLYGAGVSINQVLRLTTTDYLEQEVERIIPQHPRNVLGLHTVNRAGGLTVIDGFTRNPRV